MSSLVTCGYERRSPFVTSPKSIPSDATSRAHASSSGRIVGSPPESTTME